MSASIAKTATRWEGNSRFPLSNGMVLRIVTAKRRAGDVRSTAIVYRMTTAEGYRAEEHIPKVDFATVSARSDSMATEKLIRTLHQAVMDILPLLLQQISEHYGEAIKVVDTE